MTTLETIIELSNEREWIWYHRLELDDYSVRRRLAELDFSLKQLWIKRGHELHRKAKITHNKRSKYRDRG